MAARRQPGECAWPEAVELHAPGVEERLAEEARSLLLVEEGDVRLEIGIPEPGDLAGGDIGLGGEVSRAADERAVGLHVGDEDVPRVGLVSGPLLRAPGEVFPVGAEPWTAVGGLVGSGEALPVCRGVLDRNPAQIVIRAPGLSLRRHGREHHMPGVGREGVVLGNGERLARRRGVAVAGGDVAAATAGCIDDKQMAAFVADVVVPVPKEEAGEDPRFHRIVGDRLLPLGIEAVTLGEGERAVFGMNGGHEDDPAAVGAPGGVLGTGGDGREAYGGAAGRRNDMELRRTGAVGLEEDRLPVGRPARPGVLRRPLGDRQGPRRGRTVGRGNPQSRSAAIGLWVDRRHLPDNLRAVGGDLRIGEAEKTEQVLDFHRAPSHRLGSRAGGEKHRTDHHHHDHEGGETGTHG